MASIPETHVDLLAGPYYAIFSTVSPESEPENSIVWASWDGEYVLINTVVGRRKDDNIRQNPNVAVCVLDPEDPYRWIDVRGVVAEIVPDTDYANINAHAKLYQGVDDYYGGVADASLRGKQERVIYHIRPEHVVTMP